MTSLSCLTLFFSVLLFLALLSTPIDARNSKRFKRGHYADVYEQELVVGKQLLQATPGQQPQQVATTLSGTTGTITVTWVTFNATGTSLRYGSSPIYSPQYTFVVPPFGSSVVNMVVFGDMGVVNAVSMQNVIKEVQSGYAHMVLHVGDFAYDLHTEEGTWGDVFFNDIMPFSTRVPYIGCQGNHEGKYNASHYINRFHGHMDMGMTSHSGNNWWFSWDYISGNASVHMVAINTEMYYVYVDENPPPNYAQQRAEQYAWLDADLAQARKTSDWVIVYGHRPMYCSDVDSFGDCTSDATTLREGINGQYGMDDMIAQHNVDIYFTAHEHSYERIFPVWRGQMDPQQNHTHHNPKYPIHIVTGSAGCQEYLEWFDDVNYPAWSCVRSPTYGYGHLRIHNHTHLYWEQLINEGRDGLDTLWISRDQSRKGQQTMDVTAHAVAE